jgi:hypothetical protein
MNMGMVSLLDKIVSQSKNKTSHLKWYTETEDPRGLCFSIPESDRVYRIVGIPIPNKMGNQVLLRYMVGVVSLLIR